MLQNSDSHWRLSIMATWLQVSRFLPGLGFCLASATAFIFMASIVRHDGPALATLLTYGMTSVFFWVIGLLRAPNWIKSAGLDVRGLVLINGLTVANTFLVYVILLHVSAFTYVLVFFGTLPVCVAVLRSDFRKARSLKFMHGALVAGIVIAAFLSSQTSRSESLIGIILSIISAIAGAAYLDASKDFQIKTNLRTTDILALRFIGTIMFASMLLALQLERITVTLDSWMTYVLISIVGSIVPLYLLQKSNQWIGPDRTSRLMPLIPLLCLLLSFLGTAVSPSLVDVAVVTAATTAMLMAFKPSKGYEGKKTQ
jgi:drug/metabolite transporter (DMT)-like permease